MKTTALLAASVTVTGTTPAPMPWITAASSVSERLMSVRSRKIDTCSIQLQEYKVQGKAKRL